MKDAIDSNISYILTYISVHLISVVERLVTLCQYYKVLFLRTFPVRNIICAQVQFWMVMEILVFVM